MVKFMYFINQLNMNFWIKHSKSRWLGNTDSMDMNLSKLQEIVEDWGAWHAAAHGVTNLDTS